MVDSEQHLCEACGQPVEAGAEPVRVGSCEFPFWAHDACRDKLGSVAGFIEELCVLSDEQPEGILNLGGWDMASAESQPELEAFLQRYVEGEAVEEGRLNLENGAVYLDGWWPVVVGLPEGAQLVRADMDPEGFGLRDIVAGVLTQKGMQACTIDEGLAEAVALQRLGLLGASWQLWAPSDEVAEKALAAAAAG